MIGYASHRLQLGAGKILEPHAELLAKVNELMRRMGSIKNRARLWEKNAPMPIQRNATRWSSTFAMIQCYFEMKHAIDRQDKDVAAVCPSATEELTLEDVFR